MSYLTPPAYDVAAGSIVGSQVGTMAATKERFHMITAYQMLGRLAALLILLQAGTIGYSSFAHGDATASRIHEITGMMVLPVVVLAMLIVAFLAKSSVSIRFGVVLVLLLIIQIGLGSMGPKMHWLGALHGVIALVLFGAAAMAAVMAGREQPKSATS